MKEFDLLNEEMKKKNSESNILLEVYSNERIRIHEELLFYNATLDSNNPESLRKEEAASKKVKKEKNRV